MLGRHIFLCVLLGKFKPFNKLLITQLFMDSVFLCIVSNGRSFLDILLPPAEEVWGKVMFYTCLSVILFTVATGADGTHPTGMHTCVL